MAVVLTVEALRRYLFHAPSVWAYEVSLYLFSAVFLFGGAFALARGAHVTIDVVYHFFSERGKVAAKIISYLIVLLVCGIVVWKTGVAAWESFLERDHSLTQWAPAIYPLRIMITVGTGFMLIEGFVLLIRNVHIGWHWIRKREM